MSFFSVSCRYGFDRERSKQALEAGGGEFGATLEHLLLRVFCERFGQKAVCPDGLREVPVDECLAQRQEEALALAAIYGERFSERIANAVWTVNLDLSFLSGSAAGQGGADGNRPARAQKVCQFYLKGKGCRFGDKCKFKHQLLAKERPGGGPPDPNGPSQPGFSSYSPPVYELEIRFPKGNRYPSQAPVVAFSTTDESVGAAGRLCVSERLFSEAVAAARSSEPVVYTLITLCEDEAAMRQLLAAGHHKYSTPPPPLAAARLPPPAMAKSKSARSGASEENGSGGNRTSGRKRATPSNNRAVDGERHFTVCCSCSPNGFDALANLASTLKGERRRRSWTRGTRKTRTRTFRWRTRVTST